MRRKVLESALRSGKVPLEGCREAAFGKLERVERIEGKIGAETEINIPRNEVRLRNVYLSSLEQGSELAILEICFQKVRADGASLKKWLRENALPAGSVNDEPMAARDEAPDDIEAERSTLPAKRQRYRPCIVLAKTAVDALYPVTIPDQALEPNKTPCGKVKAKLKENKLGTVSDDSILRAAGRRK
jgi:hypothetical protein